MPQPLCNYYLRLLSIKFSYELKMGYPDDEINLDGDILKKTRIRKEKTTYWLTQPYRPISTKLVLYVMQKWVMFTTKKKFSLSFKEFHVTDFSGDLIW